MTDDQAAERTSRPDEPTGADRGTERVGQVVPLLDRPGRAPLLIWAVYSLASVILRSATTASGWSLDAWGVLAQWHSHEILAWVGGEGSQDSFVMPGYALVVRGTQWVTGDLTTTAVLVSYVSSALASYLLWEWMAARGAGPAVRAWSVLALLSFPYSFVLFGVVGPDAMALALVLGTAVLLDRGRHVPAGLCAAAAMTVSVTALALLPALAVFTWLGARAWPLDREGVVASGRSSSAPGGRTSDLLFGPPGAAFGLACLGPVLLTAFSAWDRGDAWVVWSGEGALRGLDPGVFRLPTWIRVGWLLEDAPMSWALNRAAQTLVLVAFVAAAYLVWKRFGAAPATLVLGVVLMTLIGFADVASAGRRLTAAFPVAALAGLGLARINRVAAGALVGASTVAMFTFYVFYLRSTGFPFW